MYPALLIAAISLFAVLGGIAIYVVAVGVLDLEKMDRLEDDAGRKQL